jgi:hypothetical protein
MTMTKKSLPRYLMTLAGLIVELTGCASNSVRLMDPQSGASADCSASGVGFSASLSAAVVENCSRLYEDRGYVRIEKLTPEQRASLERRGLLR